MPTSSGRVPSWSGEQRERAEAWAASNASALKLGPASDASALKLGPASDASALKPGPGACQTLTSDHIYASDLAKAAPVFAALDPSMELGLAPLPGITRVFHPVDLLRIARSNGMALAGSPAGSPQEVCFERSGATSRTPGSAAKAAAALPPLAVKRGEKVAVTVVSGGVVLRFESEADSGGRPGDTVIVRNPDNGSRFAARVEDLGKVIVNK